MGVKMKTYKQLVKEHCINYYKEHKNKCVFIGYNTVKGSRMYGTLDKIPLKNCIEMPVCEGLMTSMAIGMSLEGYRPVVCFERHDFMLLALDSIINHIDKLPYLSGDRYKLPIIIRAIVGSANPLNPGPQHTGDYTQAFRHLLKNTPVYTPHNALGFEMAWNDVGNTLSGAVIIVEKRDWYNHTITELGDQLTKEAKDERTKRENHPFEGCFTLPNIRTIQE